MKSALAVWLCTLFAVSAVAQVSDFERVLVPVTITGEVPGAFGSRWVTRLAMTNTADQRVQIFGYDPYPGGCLIAVCPPVPPTPANETFFPAVPPGTISQGAIIEVDRQYAGKVRFQLRVQDVSRDTTTWGTEIPVVREGELFTGTFQLLDVPTMTGFRATLRLYDLGALDNAQVVVRFFRTNPSLQSPVAIVIDPNGSLPEPDTLLAERIVTLAVERRGAGSAFDFGYAELSDFLLIPQLQDVNRVRLEVRPATAGLRLWGFVSVTNNETQHVTVVTPQ